NLKIPLKYEETLHHIDSPLPNPPAVNATPKQVAAYQALLAEQDKVALLMLTCMRHELQKKMKNHNAYDMINELKNLFQTQASQELYDTQRLLNACTMEKGQSMSSYVLKMKSYIDKLERLRHSMPHAFADTPFEPQTEEPTLSSIILHVSELVVEEAVTNDVVEQAPPENQENGVAHAAPILRRSSRPSHPPERYYGFLTDSKGRKLKYHDEPDTYHQAMTGSKSRKWIEAMNAEMRSM
nr:hypothetical protein [Tanacetum cinerariifolium]